jgi:hypothetical protein
MVNTFCRVCRDRQRTFDAGRVPDCGLVEQGRQAFVVATNGKRAKWPMVVRSRAIKHAPDAGSPQIKSLRKQIKCRSDQFLRFFAELTVEAGIKILVSADRSNNCAAMRKAPDLITGKPSGTNLVSLGLHAVHRRRKYTHCR